ncbi:MAG: DMT family transporter [Acetobacteraceae bacterium]|nr:DMT family transporter [Acetobacteraceae bacterium]
MTVELAPPRTEVLRGIGFMCLAVFLFAANDTLGKILLQTYTVGQTMIVRGMVGLAVLLPLLRRHGLPILIRTDRPRLQLIRFALAPAEASLFFWALITLPLADVITYYQAAPIWVTALSALFLHERVGWRRWTAVFAGFAGVVLALHPQGSPAIGGLGALLGSVLYAGYLVATGRLTTIPRLVLTAQQLLATLLYGCAVTMFEGWAWPGPGDAALMLVLGLGSLAGNLCVNVSLRLGPAVSIVPFQYTMLLWGILLGWLVFGDAPSLTVLAGAALIVAAGLFILAREHRLARAAGGV